MIGLRGRDLRARLMQPRDEIWDRRLGVKFGYHDGSGEWGISGVDVPLSALSYWQIFAG